MMISYFKKRMVVRVQQLVESRKYNGCKKRAGVATRPTDYSPDFSSLSGGSVGLSLSRACCQASTSSSDQKTRYPILIGLGKSGRLVWNWVGESPTRSRTCCFDKNRISIPPVRRHRDAPWVDSP
jgi:hypothetical protein